MWVEPIFLTLRRNIVDRFIRCYVAFGIKMYKLVNSFIRILASGLLMSIVNKSLSLLTSTTVGESLVRWSF